MPHSLLQSVPVWLNKQPFEVRQPWESQRHLFTSYRVTHCPSWLGVSWKVGISVHLRMVAHPTSCITLNKVTSPLWTTEEFGPERSLKIQWNAKV